MFSGRNIHIVTPTCKTGPGYYVIEGGDQPSQYPPLWIGFTGDHYQSLETIDDDMLPAARYVNERNCESIPEESCIDETTISCDTPDQSDFDDSLFKPPTPQDHPIERSCVIVSGEDSDTATIVSLPSPASMSSSSGWSPDGGRDTSEERLNVERLGSLRQSQILRASDTIFKRRVEEARCAAIPGMGEYSSKNKTSTTSALAPKELLGTLRNS